LAEAAVARRTFEPAVVLLGAASAWRAGNDFPIPPYDRADSRRVLAAARSGLTRAAFDNAWAAGGALTLEQAVDGLAKPPRAKSPTMLTSREREVAALVARGLTNRVIADELGIAPATAALHVEHVRGKLGFHSRAEIAAWVASGMPAPT
jgi:non-specific serine/threonine protein kinase